MPDKILFFPPVVRMPDYVTNGRRNQETEQREQHYITDRDRRVFFSLVAVAAPAFVISASTSLVLVY